MPVDVYIGGEEHGNFFLLFKVQLHVIHWFFPFKAITHLFVSRLISHFLYNQNKLKVKEPFKRFISIGMVKGESFKKTNQFQTNEKLFYDNDLPLW